jgi:hypothetical protein
MNRIGFSSFFSSGLSALLLTRRTAKRKIDPVAIFFAKARAEGCEATLGRSFHPAVTPSQAAVTVPSRAHRRIMAITSVRIHPAIGVARVGNSPEFFIGPEEPGVFTPPSDGKYKDALCRVKKQAARFRLFAFDGNTFVKELKDGDPDVEKIEWTVHLANRKAASRIFAQNNKPVATTPADAYPAPSKFDWRNPDEADRSKLVIDAGPKTLDGPNQAAAFNNGKIYQITVPLGEMRTEADGRLLVLGGFGKAASFNGSGLNTFADNSGWYDDVSDGPVTAKVTLTGGATPPVEPAWVIVGPPKFAPAIPPIVTMYDTLLQAWKNAHPNFDPGYSVDADVEPFFARIQAHQYVNQLMKNNHSFNAGPPPAPGSGGAQGFVGWLNNPNNPVSGSLMPRMWSSSFEKNGAVEPLQYEMFQRWAGLPNTVPLPQSGPALTVYEKLDRAALEACIGGNLYPGIEASWWMLEKFQYTAPFRLNHAGMKPGIITSQMAVPWQSDFSACFQDQGFAWWPAQRPDQVTRNGAADAEWHLDFGNSRDQMVATWDHLGFVLPEGNGQVEKERFAVCKDAFIITDRNEFSLDEVNAVLTGGEPFTQAFYVMVEGYTPAELGFQSPNPADLGPIAPKVTFFRPDNSAAAQMTGVVEKPAMLQSNDLDQAQRITFSYRVDFAGIQDFLDGANQPIEEQTFTLKAEIKDVGASAPVRLIDNPNPYMLDGSTTWLSKDLRVFQVTDGGPTPWGPTFNGSDANAARTFIAKTIDDFNAAPANAQHPFLSLKTGQESSKLELSPSVGGDAVFNFAIARVRYQAETVDAENVRVFFRMFTTAATGMEYRPGETYRRFESGSDAIALLGLQAGDVVTLPFFAAARETANPMTMQSDPKNVQPLKATGGEFFAYFGCWLDFNQIQPLYPLHPAAPDPVNGPYTVNRKSLQEHIRDKHQCLVAEIFYLQDQIPNLATPGSSDQLAQRNLMIVESDNPGAADSHTVAHTFQIGARRTVQVQPQRRTSVRAAVVVPREDGVDELMIHWGNLPRESDVQVYLPGIDAEALLHQAGVGLDVPRLERVDDHTLRLLPADVSFIPIPPDAQQKPIAGLLRIVVPDDVRVKQRFRVVVHQICRAERRVIGSFQLDIPVDLGRNLLRDETRFLSVLRHIARSVPRESAWDAVMTRYLDIVANRVRGFGGDPDRVEPSPDGGEGPAIWSWKRSWRALLCRLLRRLFGPLAAWFRRLCRKLCGPPEA